jgi:hypothetical protein
MVNLWRASHTGFFGDFLALGSSLAPGSGVKAARKDPKLPDFLDQRKAGGREVEPHSRPTLLLCSVPLFLRKYFKK